MKRVLSLIVCFLMLTSLFGACGSSESEVAGTGSFMAGYGTADISPQESIYLWGYGDEKADRMSTTVTERLWVTTVALTDAEGKTLIFMATDLLQAESVFAEPVRKAVAEATGVPLDQVMFHCSHNHGGPDPRQSASYQALLTESCVQSAKDAMADRKPAQMFTTFSRPEGFNFVRHYLLASGKYRAEGVGLEAKENIIGHTGQPDNLLQLVKFTREDGKDIMLMNWQGHPRGNDPDPRTAACANYAGVMRTTVAEGLDCLPVFVLSGSGNMNNNSQIVEEVKHASYVELGKALGQEVITASANFKPAATDKMLMTKKYLNTNGQEDSTGGTPLYAFSIGDFAIVTAPFEIFSTNAQAVKEESAFPMTFYASCSNESRGYLPTPEPFQYEHSYEVRITKYPMGTAEVVQGMLSTMLDDLFAEGGYTEAEKPEGYIQPEFGAQCDGKEYMNANPGNLDAYEKVENDFYRITMLVNGKPKTMLCISEDVAKQVLATTTTKLLLNEQNVVVGIAE